MPLNPQIPYQDPQQNDDWIPVGHSKIQGWKDVAQVVNNWAEFLQAHLMEHHPPKSNVGDPPVNPPTGKHPPPPPPFGG